VHAPFSEHRSTTSSDALEATAFQPAKTTACVLTPKGICMTAPNSPTAAQQARASYRQMTDQLGHLGLDAAVPEGVRALAEKSLAQTRQAYDQSVHAFDASLTTFERTFDAAGQGASAFNRKIIDLARRNVDASFELATSLAGAKTLADIVELQAAFWRKQFGALTAQAEEVRALSSRVTADTAEPIKSQMARGAPKAR
jgi:phasin